MAGSIIAASRRAAMKYYEYDPDMDRFDSLEASKSGDKILATIKGERLGDSWKPIRVKVQEEHGVMGDFPYLSPHYKVPVFSERAWQALQELVGPYVEALPLKSEVGDFFAINVLHVEDCLDEERSEFSTLENGKIYAVDEHVFKKGYTPKSPIFWLPQVRDKVLVTDVLRKQIEKHKLKGLLWSPLD
jgi:hypothetical protein